MNRFLALDTWGVIRRWEFWLFILVVITFVWASTMSPYFFSLSNLFSVAQQQAVVALLALGLAPVILAGEIDLSIASISEVSLVTFALLWHAGITLWVAVALSLIMGTLLGFINGVLVTVLKISSLAVTIGTMIAYAGLALLMMGGGAITGFPTALTALGVGTLGQSPITISILILAGASMVVGVIIHGSRMGKYIYAVGGNKEASRFAGVPVNTVKIFVFILSGLFAAGAGIMYAAYLDTAIANAASTDLLPAVTIVLFGGVDFVGGSGTLLGVLMAWILISTLENGLGLIGVSGEVQIIAVGLLLIASLSVKNFARGLRLRTKKRVETP